MTRSSSRRTWSATLPWDSALKESVLRGASEVFSAVVAASLSLLSVLLPVSFIGGFIGAYVQQFSLGMAAAVAFSLLEAVLFLTVRLAYTPELKDLTWRDFLHSWILLPESIRWGLKSWRKAAGIIVGFIAAVLILVFTHKALVSHCPGRPTRLHSGWSITSAASPCRSSRP